MITSYEKYIDILDNWEHPASQRAVTEAISEGVLLRTIQERPDLKEAVIHNKLIPESVLISLIDDPDARIREAVANKRKLSMPYLEKLTRDPDRYVRQKVVEHRKITKHILEILALDDWVDVAEQAKQRLEKRDYQDK